MDRIDLERLYVQEQRSYEEIAAYFEVSVSTICRWVKKFDLVGKRKIEFEDLTGQEFGSLKVVKHVKKGRYPKGGVYHVWECCCKCGEVVYVRGGNLKEGQKTCKICASNALSDKLKQFPFDSKVWFRILYRVKNKGLDLDVTADYLYDLFQQQQGVCAITGVPIHLGRSGQRTTTASPDRIDSSKGYVVGNVQWVHKTVNSMRNSMSLEEFRDWCKLVVDFKTPA